MYNKKEFSIGLVMMAAFLTVLVLFFLPLFGGKNGLDYLDNLYNSISKGSAYYIPELQESAQEFVNDMVDVEFALESPEQAAQAASVLEAAGFVVAVDGSKLHVQGGMGKLLLGALEDADILYANGADRLQDKYGIDGRQVVYNWWSTLKAMGKSLTKQEHFKEAAVIEHAMARGVEPAYNFYGIEAQDISDRIGMVIFSLAFYVVYTLWYGFAILFMFEGWGLKLSH